MTHRAAFGWYWRIHSNCATCMRLCTHDTACNDSFGSHDHCACTDQQRAGLTTVTQASRMLQFTLNAISGVPLVTPTYITTSMVTPSHMPAYMLLGHVLADLAPGYCSVNSAAAPCAKGSFKEGIGFATSCSLCSIGVTTLAAASGSALDCSRECMSS
jgi:hypothetical protein